MKTENSTRLFYKYLDVEGARLTLKNKTFKHAKPSDFHDIEDMTIQSIFPESLEVALVKIRDNFLDILERNRHKTPTCESPMKEHIQCLQALTPEAFALLKRELANDAISSIYKMEVLKKNCSEFINEINRKMQDHRVLCVCKVKNSEKMWQDYAENHQGIVLCIQPDLEKDSKFRNFRKIIYRSSRPSFYDNALRFLEDSFFGDQEKILELALDRIIYTKTLKWKHEQEYRLSIPLSDFQPDWNTLTYHSAEISELYLGASMSDHLKTEMIGLAKEVNPKIKIFSATREDENLIFTQM